MRGPDFKQIAGELLGQCPGLLFEWFPNGKVDGHEFCIGSVQGEAGQSLRFNWQKNVGEDFANPDSFKGDIIDLYCARFELDKSEAYKQLAGDVSAAPAKANGAHRPAPAPKKAPTVKPIVPVPNEGLAALKPRVQGASANYAYRDANGGIIFVVSRFDADGKKVFRQWTYGELDGEIGWHPKAYPAPRPLFGLNFLEANNLAPVLVVEGEKCVCAARDLGTACIAVTWPGGAAAVKYADWSVLAGRRVAIWPDNDEPGRKAAGEILELAYKHGAEYAAIMPIPEGVREGEDLADLKARGEIDMDRLAALVENALTPPPDDPDTFDDSVGSDPRLPHPLGIYHDHAVMLNRTSNQVVHIPKHWMARQSVLLSLAPMDAWEKSRWAHDSKRGVTIDWNQAGGDLNYLCAQLKYVDPLRRRARGVWRDGDRIVANLGDRLWVDGEIRPKFRSKRFIYEMADGGWPHNEPATDAEATKLRELVAEAKWIHPYFGVVLAGWLTVAPLAGSLPWRPNVWLTGSSGSGKTWVLDNIVRPSLGSFSETTSGSTTEAGVRQLISGKALAFIWDEFEAESERDSERRRRVLEMLRAATSGDGIIRKGSAMGTAVPFTIRSAFLFASIGTSLRAKADVGRTMIIELKRPTKGDREWFEGYRTRIGRFITKELGDRLVWRSITMAKAILESSKVFHKAMLQVGDARTADLHAPLFAGWWALGSRRVPTAQEASDAVVNLYHDWHLVEHAGAEEDVEGGEALDAGTSDEMRCLDRILDRVVVFTHTDGAIERNVQKTIRELVTVAARRGEMTEAATDILPRFGLNFRDGRLVVSSSHSWLEDLFRGTPWDTDWNRTLARLEGTERVTGRRVVEGHKTVMRRGVAIPAGYCVTEV